MTRAWVAKGRFVSRIGGTLIALFALAGCSAADPLYRPAPSLYTAGPQPDYARYLAGARSHLRRYVVPVEGFDRASQVGWRMPFERRPAPGCSPEETTGLLLIHGLADTPFTFRDLADRLAQRCVHVRAILLPGHGTRPGDLVTAEAEQWFAAARSHADDLSERVDRLWLGGHSIGGAIATVLALERSDVDGLLALAPAWELDGLRSALWAGTLAEPFIDFLEQEPELNPVKYESLAVNTGDEVGEVRAAVQDALEARAAVESFPLLLVATEADSVIELDYLRRNFARFTHPSSHMLVYRDRRRARPTWWEPERMSERMAWLPEQRIAEMSHQSLPVAPDNPLYGVGGALQHCLEPNGLSPRACRERRPDQVWYAAYRGEDERTPGRVTSRLTWNPHFAALVERIAAVMDLPEASARDVQAASEGAGGQQRTD